MSRAGLARRLGVSRTRVTQVLGLLELAPEAVDAVAGLGDPLPGPIVTERMLRRLRTLPSAGQLHALAAVSRGPARPCSGAHGPGMGRRGEEASFHPARGTVSTGT